MIRKAGLAAAVLLSPVALLVSFVVFRHIVFWAPGERVTFESAGVRLVGTLLKPSHDSVFPAVIM